MGQKINPESIRLLINQNYYSNWYTLKKDYSKLAKEDHFARTLVNNFFKKFLYISSINVSRINSLNKSKIERVKLILNSFFPTYSDILNNLKKEIEVNNIIAKQYT